jgi:hypothetical protein
MKDLLGGGIFADSYVNSRKPAITGPFMFADFSVVNIANSAGLPSVDFLFVQTRF